MNVYYWAQALVTAVVIYDMYRRPESAWAAADRQRIFWALLLGALGAFGLGPAGWLAYGLVVYPKLGAGSDPFPVSEEFRKR